MHLSCPTQFSDRTEWQYAPGIWDSEHVTGWKKIVDAVHEAGGKIYAQVRRIYFST